MTLSLAEQQQDQQDSPRLSPEETVRRIREGADELRSPFIAQYRPFIAAATARLINAPAQGRDEYSIALDAFNEAIDRYDAAKNKGFLSWCDLVINHRVIDYIRSNRKHGQAYPFTYYEAAGSEDLIERAVQQNPSILTENMEIKEEILAFRQRLGTYGIKLVDLVECAPKHIDSRVMCVMLARKLAASKEMSEKLERTGQLPVALLLESVQVGRKAIENNRKYIIAIYIILTSGMEIIKSYIDFMQEGVSGK
jgi:RNA polymerase sigma factor